MSAVLEQLPHATWRLLMTGLRDGATNMAIDEAILVAVADGMSPPTIRFYGWDPPCVSIGYAQAMRTEIDLDICRQAGYGWVRRPTGGRAVLHIDELTYSVVAPQGEPRVAGDIVTSYRRISRGLVAGLEFVGCRAAQADYQDGVGTAAKSAACFDVPSHYEVTALGRKLVGSAQVRRKGVVLQHGALPLAGNVTRLVDVLAMGADEKGSLRAKLASRATTLEQVLGKPVEFREVANALARGFSQALQLTLQPGELSPGEMMRAAKLRERYRADEWTFSR